VTLKVRTKGYRGNILKGATVISNDPQFPRKFLRISVVVQPVIACNPTSFLYVDKPFGRELSKTLALWSPIYPKFRIVSITSEVPHVSAKIIKSWMEKGRMHYNLRVVFGEKMPIGRFRGALKIATNLKKYPEFSLRLSVRVEGPIQVLPDRGIIFSDPSIMGGMAATGFSIYGKNLKISRIETNAKKLKVQLIPVVAGQKYYLAVIWPGGDLPTLPYKVSLKIHTNNPVQPLVMLPLELYTRRQPTLVPPVRPPGSGSR